MKGLLLLLLLFTPNAFSYDLDFIAGGRTYISIRDGTQVGLTPSQYMRDNDLTGFYPFIYFASQQYISAVHFPWLFLVQKFEHATCYQVISSPHISCLPNSP